ncbi:hypothetical protein [Anoxybacillus ayderensis]|uniref:hypothetical protein n=1 Tax=Anoxybacillus ayderensis TaxID=265546 RepID=UPI000A267A90|nr:hypothetical protein [Anoxybacillus ayderensis]MBA2877628.1 hypothetical protein [Anoxybacillus ayderensis]OSX53100.1 hypothetical protein B7H16_13540 [Anoxybacillus ayderensis]
MNSQHIQLQQKIIHYRSEVAKYKQLLQLVETELKREQLRNQYVQKKLEQLDEYEQTIEQLKQQLLFYEVALEEEKRRKKEIKQDVVRAYAYFTYAVMMPEQKEEEATIIGDFVIENSGNTPLNDPIICLRLRPPDHAQLSGKFSFRQMQEEGGWTFAVEDWRKKMKEGEYWLKPIDETTLLPNEQLRFPSFELRIVQTVVVEAFVYFRQLKQGVSSSNYIVVNK